MGRGWADVAAELWLLAGAVLTRAGPPHTQEEEQEEEEEEEEGGGGEEKRRDRRDKIMYSRGMV